MGELLKIVESAKVDKTSMSIDNWLDFNQKIYQLATLQNQLVFCKQL